MDVRLDVEDNMLYGTTILEWKNPSTDTVPDLQFHLYYNAFKNTRSTFLANSNGFGNLSKKMQEECGYSYTEVISIIDSDGNDLMAMSQYIAPDDNNEYDQTVLQVFLDNPVLPATAEKYTITWEAKIPKAKARTGYNQEYYFFAQWFPKVGVYEPSGMRYAKVGAWNCHQYHASGEYYGEFGNYDVTLRVPSTFIVASSGTQVEEKVENNVKVVRSVLNDVIDFTWSASPHFVKFERDWRDVKLMLYTYPGHEVFLDRYFESTVQSLEYMDKHVGKYPYASLSIIDPPIHGLFTGGMEYPTLISSLSFKFFPPGIKTPETLVVHEFIHQYFMQMVSTHEQEEPWMDEGITTYYEGRILDEYYGKKTSIIDTWGVQIGNKEFNRIEFWSNANPKIADNSYRARDFVHGGYGTIAYNKTAMMLKTLEGILGQEMMDNIMKAYFEKWKFKHPCGSDFVAVFKDMLSQEILAEKKLDIDRFFDEALYGSDVCDYAVASIRNSKAKPDFGYLENNSDCTLISVNGEDSIFISEVIIHRLGEMVLPIDVHVHFDDGSSEEHVWDGSERSKGYQFKGVSEVIKVQLDPQRKLDLEKNFINNSLQIEKSNTYRKYTSKFKVGMQHLLDFLNFLS